jgi:hypothetical protein
MRMFFSRVIPARNRQMWGNHTKVGFTITLCHRNCRLTTVSLAEV